MNILQRLKIFWKYSLNILKIFLRCWKYDKNVKERQCDGSPTQIQPDLGVWHLGEHLVLDLIQSNLIQLGLFNFHSNVTFNSIPIWCLQKEKLGCLALVRLKTPIDHCFSFREVKFILEWKYKFRFVSSLFRYCTYVWLIVNRIGLLFHVLTAFTFRHIRLFLAAFWSMIVIELYLICYCYKHGFFINDWCYHLELCLNSPPYCLGL